MRTKAINASLEGSISGDRLRKYFHDGKRDLDEAIEVYEQNMLVSEAFYPLLQILEVCLRNRINAEMIAKYGRGWLRDGSVPLEENSVSMIDEAWEDLKKEDHEKTASDLVAKAKFAFWVGLMGPSYDNTLWREAIYKSFPNATQLKRKKVHSRLNAIRRFRNRIAHHEPIFHRPVLKMHSEIIEAIGWMCVDTQAWASHHSRVLDVTPK